MNRLLTSHLGGEGKLKAVWLEGTEALSTLYRIRVRLISPHFSQIEGASRPEI